MLDDNDITHIGTQTQHSLKFKILTSSHVKDKRNNILNKTSHVFSSCRRTQSSKLYTLQQTSHNIITMYKLWEQFLKPIYVIVFRFIEFLYKQPTTLYS